MKKLDSQTTSGNQGKGVTVNLSAPITITSTGGDRSNAQKTGEIILSQLERVVSQAEAIARFT